MKIGPLFKWFGSKWQSAKRYPAPRFAKICEPFAGGAGYSLNYCDRQVWINEADPNLLSLWHWLITDAKQQEILDIPINLSEQTDIRSLGLNQGQSLLLKHWQRTNNVGDCWTISPWGHLPGQWTANTRARVAEQVQAIKHWQIGVPGMNSTTDVATWFVDPMYQYNYHYRAGLQKHDYEDLGKRCQWLAALGHQVIVCEAIGKKGEIPVWLPFEASHKSVTSRRKETQNHHSKELVWCR